MPDVRMPDGAMVRFPDTMPPEQIKGLIASKFPDAVKGAMSPGDFQGRFDPLGQDAAPKGDRLPMAPGVVQQPQPELEEPPRSWGNVAQSAVGNLGPSAIRFGGDLFNAVAHPVETVQNIVGLALGTAEKLIPGQQGHEQYADAVGKFFADRYGGLENVKKTMAEDPVGFLADISTILTGGGALAAKVPGVAKAASVAGRVGSAIDPIQAVAKGTRAAGNVAAAALGVTTGAGADAIKTAARAGFAGGESGKAFRANMRGNVPIEEVIADAKAAVANLKQQRQAAYKAGMGDLAQDQTVLDFSKIDKALNAAKPIKQYKGVSLEPSAAQTAEELAQTLHEWRGLPPADFHTAEGFDALKQRIGDIRSSAKPGSPAEAMATQVYNIVKAQIVHQSPKYAKTMEGYQRASELIREMEGTLSLNRNARIDTQLRKLQSVMRNNVNTTYGRRVDLAKILEANGATNLLAKLAGQALNTLEPRGLSRAVAGVVGAGGGGAALLSPAAAIPTLASLATMSPRLVGEVAHAGGRLARAGSKVPVAQTLKGLYQLRAADPERKYP